MSESNEVHDLSFLTLLALQEVDCLRRGDPTDAAYLSVFGKRMEAAFAEGFAPADIAMYADALRSSHGGSFAGRDAVVRGMRVVLALQREVVDLNAAVAGSAIPAPDLRILAAFLRSLHGRLLSRKREEAAGRAAARVLRRPSC